eukprot:1157443-Pelagomonas_calceolata.AAC.3
MLASKTVSSIRAPMCLELDRTGHSQEGWREFLRGLYKVVVPDCLAAFLKQDLQAVRCDNACALTLGVMTASGLSGDGKRNGSENTPLPTSFKEKRIPWVNYRVSPLPRENKINGDQEELKGVFSRALLVIASFKLKLIGELGRVSTKLQSKLDDYVGVETEILKGIDGLPTRRHE